MITPSRTFFLLLSLTGLISSTQGQYWQQRADYTIQVALDTETHQYEGEQTVVYTNNSPDTLFRFFFHLYPNAFQPGSMMDERSKSLPDSDPRVGSRISALSPSEQGFLHLTNMMQDGSPAIVMEEETIAVIQLAKPILPGAKTTFTFDFQGQVPIQIRRSGRDNAEGVDYSMTQWYPKVVEYDPDGWHANPYIGREFYGVWGDFDVTVALPSEYVFAATGYAREADPSFAEKRINKLLKKKKYTAHRMVAPNVHDFTWAADPDYRKIELTRKDGTVLEFFFIPGENTTENWEALPAVMDEAFDFINENYGQYPYEKYAFIQGGDGGMEYAMCTLITGERSLRSLVGVSVHELMHTWYQFLLGTNESLFPWMDEGFTSYASAEVMNSLAKKGAYPNAEVQDNPHAGTVMGYARFANSGRAEALSTHADHYTTNAAYGVGSYVKGELFLYQLRSIIGEDSFNRGMLRYFREWSFKHPDSKDFIRIMERESGQELDWYLEYMQNTTHQIDYAVDSLYKSSSSESVVRLKKVGPMPFPITVQIIDNQDNVMSYLIPIVLQRGHAPLGNKTLAADWPWTNATYELRVPVALEKIKQVLIDPALEMSESDKTNNVFPREPDTGN